MKAIGELLVALGLTTPEQVRAALENQAVFGGRLGTNLLELGAVTEERLAEALGRRFGVPARAGEIEVAREALELLRADVAARLEVVPVRVDGRKLDVAVANPADLARLDEVAFATGKQVRPVLVVEARLWELLRRHYGVERVLRGIGAAGAPVSGPGGAEAVAREPAADLMGEEAFEELYAAAAHLPSSPRRPLCAPASPPRAVARSSAPVEAPEPEGADGPLDVAEAEIAVAQAHDRAGLGRVLLRVARAHFRRAALLEVAGEYALGTDAVGDGVDRAAVATVRLRLRDAGLVGSVVRTRAHVLGPFLRTEQNVRLLRALGAGEPLNAFAMPLVVGGRAVAALYADGGPDAQIGGAGVADLLIVAARVGRAWDALGAAP